MTTICDILTDAIYSDSIARPFARFALMIARLIDPTESSHAAHIRDALRDTE